MLRSRFVPLAMSAFLLMVLWPAPAPAYIGGPPTTLGMMCSWSTHACLVRVEQVIKDKNVIVFRKVRDLKGKWPAEVIKQVINTPDRPYILEWATPGKTTMMFALESYKWSHTYIDKCWYASTTTDWSWWNMNHVEPILLRWYCGRADRLADISASIYAGQEVPVPCMVGDNMNDLQLRRARVWRLKASLKIQGYDPKAQFVAWGSGEFTTLAGMPGFSRYSGLPCVGPDAQAISCVDLDGDGSLDLCLSGAGKFTARLLKDGEFSGEVTLPGFTGGCRAAVWADYNGDGKPDLLLATLAGPKLYTNLGNGNFRDDTKLLPAEPCYNLTAAAWLDYDGDGKPDLLLAMAFTACASIATAASWRRPVVRGRLDEGEPGAGGIGSNVRATR